MFLAAWEASFKQETILKAFKAISLLSFKLEIILKRFNLRQPILGILSNSNFLVLSASN